MPDLGRPLHWLAGFALGVPYRFLPERFRLQRLGALNRWAFAREQRQNLAGKDPNPTLSKKQEAEALAWGDGFRIASGLPRR